MFNVWRFDMTEQKENQTGLWASLVREMRQLVSRPAYVLCMVVAPLFCCLFMFTLMHEGLPHKIPVAIVDQDHSSSSQDFTRQLGALESVDVQYKLNSFTEARELMQAGDIFGFLMIPEGFEAKATAGRQPEISFYTNNAYFIPASLLYKSFKTMSVLASGAVVRQVLLATGVEESQIMAKLQPIAADMHALGNPWISYSVYLNNSFLPGLLQLMILLVTVFSIGSEIKRATAREWLRTADDSIIIAITGKLLPQTIIFFAVGLFYLAMLYGYLHFPMQGNIWHMIFAMFLLVVATQSFAVIIMSIAPSLRIGLSAAGLVGVLSLSIAGFSFPVPAMYLPFQAMSYVLPVRHYFLIYVDQALNGIPLYYSRWHYVALILFAVASTPLLPRLKKALMRQVYVP